MAKPKREARVSLLERKTRVQPLAKPKREVHVSLPEREIHVEEQGLLKRDLRISTHTCEVRVQPPKAKKSAELESPHPHGFETSSSNNLTIDLSDYLSLIHI